MKKNIKLKKIVESILENNQRKEKMRSLVDQWKESLEEVKNIMRKRGYDI